MHAEWLRHKARQEAQHHVDSRCISGTAPPLARIHVVAAAVPAPGGVWAGSATDSVARCHVGRESLA